VEALGLATGGRLGIRLAQRLGIEISRTTIIRRVRDLPSVGAVKVRHVGIDDFSFRRGRKFGTILVDLEKHRVIDVLADRQAETSAAWLRAHPEIEVVSRDRGADYAQAARLGAPQAVVVADRFHLMQNLAEASEVALTRLWSQIRKNLPVESPIHPKGKKRTGRRAKIAAETPENRPEEQPLPSIADWRAEPTAKARKIQRIRQAERLDLYQLMYRLREAGLSHQQIAQQVGKGVRTVQRWLEPGATPQAERRCKKFSSFDAYAPYVLARWQEGCHNSLRLWREIKTQGYPHSPRRVNSFVKTLRDQPILSLPTATYSTPAGPGPALEITPQSAPDLTEVAPGVPNTQPSLEKPAPKVLTAKKAVWLFVKAEAALAQDERQTLSNIQTASPEAQRLYELVQQFRQMLHQRTGDSETLTAWLTAVRESQIEELVSFGAGLEKDRQAVIAGLTLSYSNGQVEGQNTKLKLLKRMMYGRAKVDLLRQRVLHAL
jgi:transposase